MAYRQTPFALDEWYHCYTRSIERGSETHGVLSNSSDSRRFLEALHLANSTEPIRRSDLFQPEHEEIFALRKGKPLIAIGAFCLMPTHFHLLLKERIEGGISKVMQAAGTAFSMYYNLKYQRAGNVFIKPFRSKHISTDVYFSQVINYIHMNPAELREPGWKEGVVRDMPSLEKYLRTYVFSSLPDFEGEVRPYGTILDKETIEIMNTSPTTFGEMLSEARAYYAEHGTSKATP